MAEWFAKDAAQASLAEVPECRRWILRGDSATMAAAGRVFGTALPSRAGGVAHVSGSARRAWWLGPDEIWLLTDPADGEVLGNALRAALAGIDHSLVDITHRQAALELSGTHAAWLLNAGCPLDLSLAAFPIDTVTRTVFIKTEIVLWRTGAESFRLEFGRSFRGYVAGMLAEVTRELVA